MKGVLLKCARKNLRKPLIDSDKIFFYYLCSGEIGVNFIYGKIAPYWKALDQSNFGREAFRLSRQIYEIANYGNVQVSSLVTPSLPQKSFLYFSLFGN